MFGRGFVVAWRIEVNRRGGLMRAGDFFVLEDRAMCVILDLQDAASLQTHFIAAAT